MGYNHYIAVHSSPCNFVCFMWDNYVSLWRTWRLHMTARCNWFCHADIAIACVTMNRGYSLVNLEHLQICISILSSVRCHTWYLDYSIRKLAFTSKSCTVKYQNKKCDWIENTLLISLLAWSHNYIYEFDNLALASHANGLLN